MIWFVSDTHFFHENFLKFKKRDGSPARPFATVQDMNELMIENWVRVVQPGDKVYHLGDVTFDYGVEFAKLMAKLPGQKRLILGNHDLIKGTALVSYFKKVSVWKIFKEEGFVCTHVPIPYGQFRNKVQFNLHGHTHHEEVPDLHYINICVEKTNYTPVSMDWIKDKIKKRLLKLEENQ